jgi:tRNA(fMet)-specific endonuclease VapC
VAIERYLEEVVLASFPILGYGRTAAEWHAAERARLEAAGKTPPFIDGQIAAIASVNDLVLVTANTADFRGFKKLRVQSWA